MPKETIRFEIKSENRLDLPKISILSALNSLRNEELEELLPLYSVFLDRDTHLISEVQKRRIQLLSMPYAIECKDKATKEFLENYLKSIAFDMLIFDISLSVPYGFSCIDMVYAPIEINEKAYFAPSKFYTIHPRYFRVKENKLFIQKSSNEQIDPFNESQKFLTHLHPSDSGDISSFALMRKLLFTCLIKHAVITSNMNYYENLGVPPIIIQYDSSDEKEIIAILKQVQNLRSGSAAVFPKEALITLLEGKGTKADFLSFIQYCDDAMSNLIIGNVLSGNTGDGAGSYALGKVHDDRRKDYLLFDSRLIAATINKFLRDVLSLNFSRITDFKFEFDTGEEINEQLLSQVYLNLTNMGLEIPIEHIEETFKIQGITKKATSTNTFEENRRRRELNNIKLSKPLTQIDAGIEQLDINSQNLAKTLEDILSRSSSYEEAYDIILNEYEGKEFDELEDELTNAIANSNLLGEANA
jgi:phage gp29-like protein